jgi:transposase
MFSLNSSVRYYLYQGATDMRNSFDGLSGIVRSRLGKDPLSGDVFIFINKQRNLIKLLKWEAGGFELYYKRLERGTLELPKAEKDARYCQVRWPVLVMMVEGISIKKIIQRKRYLRAENYPLIFS